MPIKIQKEKLLEKLTLASRFCLSKTNAIPALQGGLLEFSKNTLTITTTDLNDFFQTKITIDSSLESKIILDIKKIVEFLQFLQGETIEITLDESLFSISSGKTVGSFDVIRPDDFPPLPQVPSDRMAIGPFLEKNLPYVLFSVSHDESRPILTGVHFLSRGDKQYLVSTDGFRLSLIESTLEKDIPSITLSSKILQEVSHFPAKKIEMAVSQNTKTAVFFIEENILITRLIEGEFPPFERVIPQTFTTKVELDREELIRNIKLSSVFARDFSSIVVFEVKKDGLTIRPKVKQEKGTVIFQEASIEGEEKNISFNYKFVLDFLSNIKSKKIVFEMTENNSPGVFKTEDNTHYVHIIMPIRTD